MQENCAKLSLRSAIAASTWAEGQRRVVDLGQLSVQRLAVLDVPWLSSSRAARGAICSSNSMAHSFMSTAWPLRCNCRPGRRPSLTTLRKLEVALPHSLLANNGLSFSAQPATEGVEA